MEQRADAKARRQVSDEEIQELLDIITGDGRAVEVTVLRPFLNVLESFKNIGTYAGRIIRRRPSGS